MAGRVVGRPGRGAVTDIPSAAERCARRGTMTWRWPPLRTAAMRDAEWRRKDDGRSRTAGTYFGASLGGVRLKHGAAVGWTTPCSTQVAPRICGWAMASSMLRTGL